MLPDWADYVVVAGVGGAIVALLRSKIRDFSQGIKKRRREIEGGKNKIQWP